jgi:hypothetical protein
MRYPVPKINNVFPWYFGGFGSYSIGQFVGGLAYYFKISDNGIYCFLSKLNFDSSIPAVYSVIFSIDWIISAI